MTTLKQNPVLFGSFFEDYFPTRPLYFPPVNIYENDRGYNIELNVPGIKKEEIKNIPNQIKFCYNCGLENNNYKIDLLTYRTKFNIKNKNRNWYFLDLENINSIYNFIEFQKNKKYFKKY